MKKKIIVYLTALLLLLFSFSSFAEIEVGQVPQDVADKYVENPENIQVSEWVTDLEIPWQLVFLPESNRALVTERKGVVRLIENGNLQSEPYFEPDLFAPGEGGLMGMAHHPEFPEKPYIYIMYTYQGQNGMVYNKVTRITDNGSYANNEEEIIPQIPGGRVHDGGRIAFGPDNKLYISTGDTWNRSIAQDMDNLGGKILRLNPDGSIPTDNPYENSYIYSLGHRNPQGLDWHPETKQLFISEHGPSGEEGLRGRDRIMVIKPGGNYGWPNSIGYFENNEYENPLIMWEEATPPSGIVFYNNDLYVATLGSESLIRIKLEHKDDYNYEVQKIERLFATGNYDGKYGRLRDIIVGPDNNLYLITSNLDGRGNPQPGDDKILKLEINEE
ncbi:MAG: PQQ-dependent sugar dehydrogenase [Bacillota bacterium]